MVYKLSALITKEGRWYVARCPELGVTTQGSSFESAKKNLEEAVELYIEAFGVEELPTSEEPPIWTSLEIKARFRPRGVPEPKRSGLKP